VTVPLAGAGNSDIDLVGRDLNDRRIDLDRIADLDIAIRGSFPR